MNLESVTAELRPRGAWEAVDFGARMVRRDAGVIYKVWFATTLPVLLLATLGIVYLDIPGWIQFAYWWLEPLFGAPVLYVISRRLFGQETDVRSAVLATPALARRNWIFLLTPLRLHFARSVAMPIVQLEQLSGERRRARAKVLNQVTLNHGIGVTVAYQHLALAIYLGIILLGFSFVPELYQDSIGLSWFNQFTDDQGVATALLNLYLFYIAQTILHPWFVGAGFGLYINCRTMLEAWDIEVAFRRMLQRRENRLGAIAGLFLLLVVVAPDSSRADETLIQPHWDSAEIQEAVESTYEDESLQTMETREVWKRIDDEEEEAEPEEEPDVDGLFQFFRGVGNVISWIVEFGLWIAVAIIVIALIVTSSRWLPYLSITPGNAPRARARVVLSSGEISEDSMPDDLPASVLELWRSGNAREALSLLYRGSVFAAVRRHGVRLPRSATEGDCMDAVTRQTDAGHSDFFSRVTGAWVWCAYGATPPDDRAVQALCSEWPTHYGAAQ